jgi:cellulose synthase/poly-beta-1,6-N-acetylglucosamine synthase-like glycosyltransferase
MRVGAVAIGRNEGERLGACLQSLIGEADCVVYVASGSQDHSVAMARSLGVTVIELDYTTPFTAARARNAGFAALEKDNPPDVVQFVDGDCRIEQGWIARAAHALSDHPEFGIITGWRTEIDPKRNIYHRMAEAEWHRPAGDIRACGGDMMVRRDTFLALGGFDPTIICSEDEEFCLRVQAHGLKVHRLPLVMTHHDIAMTRFRSWWRRTERSGHGFAEVGGMYPDHFRKERLRGWIYGGGLPLIAVAGALAGQWWVVALVALAYGFNWLRTMVQLRRDGAPAPEAAARAAFLTLSKVPNVLGMVRYHLRHLRGAQMRLIEYK